MTNFETQKVLEILTIDEKLEDCLRQASSIRVLKPVLWTILGTSYNWDSIALSQIDCKAIYDKTH